MNKLKVSLAAGVCMSAVIASAWLSIPMILPARAAPPPAGAAAVPAALAASTPAAADPALLTHTSNQTDLMGLPAPRVKPLVPAASRLPLEIANGLIFKEQTPREGMFIDLDQQTARLPNNIAAGHLKILPPHSNTTETARSFAVPVEAFRGKRIRISSWFKGKDIENFARLRLGIWGEDKRLLAEGSTAYTDPIHGTTDWRQYQIVADVPENAASIMCTVSLAGPGELWADGLQVDVVPATVATTDDQQWHLYTSLRSLYDAQLDPDVQREGRPTMRIFTDQAFMPAEAFAIYARIDRHPEKYIGKNVRFTMWIKFQDVNGTVGPAVRAWGRDLTIIARFNGDRPRGTADWKPYTVSAKIPPNADFVDFIFALNRAGKAWVDVDHVEYEVIDEKKNDLP